MFFKKNILMDIMPKNTHYANFIIEFVFFLILKKKELFGSWFYSKKKYRTK